MYRKVLILLLFVVIVFSLSCSKRMLEADSAHKLHDEYFILRKNGYYANKILLMGMLRMPDTDRGRYFLSGDTIYMVKKMRKKLFRLQGYALIDTLRKRVTLFPGDSIREKEYRLIKYPGK